MTSLYDVIIIGAGPAGLNAALHVLKSPVKPSVLLVDKITPWERPIACAEGVWCDPFRAAIDVKPEWIRFFISKAVLHSPDRTSITYFEKDKGCIINRALMQADMARQCTELGAQVRCNYQVVDVGEEREGLRNVRFFNGQEALGKVIIDASGPISGFGKREKMTWKPVDLEPAYFAVADNVPIGNDEIHVYLGGKVAPGGYAWAFPRENGTANVGIVLGKSRLGEVNIRELLSAFLRRDFPKANILKYFAGTIPCEAGKNSLGDGRMLKTGDAASTVNPISRAGIVEAMVSGGLAGDNAVRMLSAKNRKQIDAVHGDYRQSWRLAMGKAHGKLSRVKGALLKVPDADYDNAFKVLRDIAPDKLPMSKIIGLSLGRFPRLVWAVRHLM